MNSIENVQLNVSLKPVEIGVLTLTTTSGTEWVGEDQKIAHRLVKKGYMTCDVSNPSVFSSTEKGTQVLTALLKRRL